MARSSAPPRPFWPWPTTWKEPPKSPAGIEFERIARETPDMPLTEAMRRINTLGLSWEPPT